VTTNATTPELFTLDEAADQFSIRRRELSIGITKRTLAFQRHHRRGLVVTEAALARHCRLTGQTLSEPRDDVGRPLASDEVAAWAAEAHAFGRAKVARERLPVLTRIGTRQPFVVDTPAEGTSWLDKQIAFTALHEAGHAVTQRTLGYRDVTTRVYADGGGVASGTPPSGSADFRYLQLVHSVAGPAAPWVANKPYPTPKEQHAWIDVLLSDADQFRSVEQHPEVGHDAYQMGVLVREDMAAGYRGDPRLRADDLDEVAYRRHLVREATADALHLLALNWPTVVKTTRALIEHGEVTLT
jgi:hypothetical protein